MNIAIIGSREFIDLNKVNELLNSLNLTIEDTIITGGAIGVDTAVAKWALRKNIPYKIIQPINYLNKINYLFRNIEILTLADKIYAFWDGKSRGTKFVIDYCKARNKPITIIRR